MKKGILSILVACFYFGVNAQTGQIDVMKEIGEGTVFTEYRVWEDGDKYAGDPYDAKKVLKFTYNAFEKVMAFEMQDEAGKTSTNHGFGHLVPNHYTQPSVFHIEGHNFAFLYVDGLLYWLKGVSDPNSIGSFEIKGIYISDAKADDSNGSGEKKKKMSMKEKLEALKAGGVPASLTSKDHETIIKDYLASMKPIQEAATANFTDEIKKEIDAIENADAAQLAKMQADQRERSQRISEKRASEAGIDSEYTVTNNTGSRLTINLSSSGFFRTIEPGKSETINCKDNVMNAVVENSTTKPGTQVLVNGKSACGTTVSID